GRGAPVTPSTGIDERFRGKDRVRGPRVVPDALVLDPDVVVLLVELVVVAIRRVEGERLPLGDRGTVKAVDDRPPGAGAHRVHHGDTGVEGAGHERHLSQAGDAGQGALRRVDVDQPLIGGLEVVLLKGVQHPRDTPGLGQHQAGSVRIAGGVDVRRQPPAVHEPGAVGGAAGVGHHGDDVEDVVDDAGPAVGLVGAGFVVAGVDVRDTDADGRDPV